jgi:multidrug resistance efflux pump
MTPPRAPSAAARPRLVPLAALFGGVLLTASLAVAVLALRSHAGSPGGESSGGSSTPPDPVAVGHVDVEEGVTPLYPLQPGRVIEIPAKEGQAAAANAPLLRLDDTQARLQVKEAGAALEAAKAQEANARTLQAQHDAKVKAQARAVEAAKADEEQANVQAERGEYRLNKGLRGTPEDVQLAKLQVQKARAVREAEESKLAALNALQPRFAVDLARQEVAVKEAELLKAQEALKECTVRAPFAGTPLRILAAVGETLGGNPRQPALFFCPDKPRIVRAEFEQEFAAKVKAGEKVYIVDDATGRFGDFHWEGSIQRVGDWYTQRRSVLLEPLQFNDVRTLECIVGIDNVDKLPLDKRPRIGQRVRITFDQPEAMKQ